MRSVPNKVDQLFRAADFHDRKQRLARSRMTKEERAATPEVDYLRPMIADADAGHGRRWNVAHSQSNTTGQVESLL